MVFFSGLLSFGPRLSRRGFFPLGVVFPLGLLAVCLVLTGALVLVVGSCSGPHRVPAQPVSAVEAPASAGQDELVRRDWDGLLQSSGDSSAVVELGFSRESLPAVPPVPSPYLPGASAIPAGSVSASEEYSGFDVVVLSVDALRRAGGVRFKGRMGRWFDYKDGRVEAVRGLLGASTPSRVAYRLLPVVDPGSEWDVVRSVGSVRAPLEADGASLLPQGGVGDGWLLLSDVVPSEPSFGALEVFGAPAVGGDVYVVSGIVDAVEVGAPIVLLGRGGAGQRWEVRFVVRQGDFLLQAAEARLLSPEGLVLAWVELTLYLHGEETGLSGLPVSAGRFSR